MEPSVPLRVLVAPLQAVEEDSPLALKPAAARRISISGPMVSFRCAQNNCRESFPRRSAEYCKTAISCRPPSVVLVSVDKYASSLGVAASVFSEIAGDPDIMLVITVDVSNGFGSSGSLDCVRRGSNDLYGSGCSARAFERVGTPAVLY
jgi:hypothetical protein